MSLQDYKGVFVFAQQVDNEITPVSYELIGKGKELANDLGTKAINRSNKEIFLEGEKEKKD